MDNIFRTPLTKQGGVLFPETSGEILKYDFDPAVKGYIHVIIDGLTKEFINASKSIKSSDLYYAIPTLARGFVLPELSLNEIVYEGMVNIKRPGRLQVGSQLSIRFMDTQELNLTNLFISLLHNMRPQPISTNNNTIHSELVKQYGNDYNYQATLNLLFFTTDPSLTVVTSAISTIGVWPTSMPKDHFETEIGDVTLHTFTQNFSVSYINTDIELNMSLATRVLPSLIKDDLIY